MAETPRTSKQNWNNLEPQRSSTGPRAQPPLRKHQRKREHPVRFTPATEVSPHSDSSICKNSACRATMSMDDTFCKRCSCCICKQFDENKDPSLWIVCTSKRGDDSCGLSAHIGCALLKERVGVVNLGQSMQLDGSYCCASCGKVSVILECWKKQLSIAKDARRVDVLCERIDLSYRLLEGTTRFQKLHQIIKDAKEKLEKEVGPVKGVSAPMARHLVGRLSVAAEVKKLCALGIEKADEWFAAALLTNLSHNDVSVLTECRFHFEDVTSSSAVVVLEASAFIKGYRIWYCSSSETYPEEPNYDFPRSKKRILLSSLQPSTEYSCKAVYYTESGDEGIFEAKCFTKCAEISDKIPYSDGETPRGQQPHFSREINLNLTSLPDLNEEISPVLDTFIGEDNMQPVGPAFKADYNAVSCDNNRKGIGSNGTSDSMNGKVPAVSSRELPSKRAVTGNEETQVSGNRINGSLHGITKGIGSLDNYFENCVKMIRQLECDGHITKEFRMKLLTWFGLEATEQERRVVDTFVQTMIEDPSSLAEQLIHSFGERVSTKRPRIGF